MRLRFTVGAVIACALLLAAGTAFGAHGYANTTFGQQSDGQAQGIFVKVPGVPGTADCPGHRDFIKCESFTLVPDDGDGHSQFTIFKRMDSASPKLARAEGARTVYADVGWITGERLGFLLRDAQIDEVRPVNASSHRHLLGDAEAGAKYEMVRFICEQVLFGPGEERPTGVVVALLARSGDTEVPLKGISMASSGQGGYFPTGLLFASGQMPHGLLSEDQQAPPVVILGRGGGEQRVILSTEGGIVADVTSPSARVPGAGENAQMAWLKPESMSAGD